MTSMKDELQVAGVPSVTLNNGVRMPQLGLGVFLVPNDEAVKSVSTALEAGYRLIDTAAAYGNEEGVGEAIRQSGIPREEIFVTSKLWNSDHGYDKAQEGFERSLEKLRLDYLDLYLIHWPLPMRGLAVETWKGLEKVYQTGRVKAIGVSNFTPQHLEELLGETDTVPTVDQIELHPTFAQGDVRRYAGITVFRWSAGIPSADRRPRTPC